MQIKLKQCVDVYSAIMSLMEEKLDFSSAHALIMAKSELEPHITFYVESENKLVDKYADTDETGSKVSSSGQFKLTGDNASKYIAEHTELDNVPVTISQYKLMSMPDKISPKELENLMLIMEVPID